MPAWRLTEGELELSRPVGVGIVNVTDDSFFSGARSGTPSQAVDDGIALAEAGFDLLDVGAVPAAGGPAISTAEEAAQLLPAVEGLAERSGVPVTADTFNPDVANLAVQSGAAAINDISGASDPRMLEVAAATGCGLVLMHIEGRPREDRAPRPYQDVIEHLKAWFSERIEAAAAHGVAAEQLALDPGLDFDLTVADDLELLRRLGELGELGRPLFVSLSRKDFLGAVLAGSWEERLPPERREWATAGAAALAVANGASLLRLHDRSALQALRVAGAICG